MLLKWCLAMWGMPLGDKEKTGKPCNAWRLAERVVPPGRNDLKRDEYAWHLVAWRIRIMVSITELHSMLRIVVCNWIIPTCDLLVVASRRMGHELELVVARVILRISSKSVELGSVQRKMLMLRFEDCSSHKGRGFKFIFTIFCILFLFFSSPYLRVFGDDQVDMVTREQMLLQVSMWMLRAEEGLVWGLLWIFLTIL